MATICQFEEIQSWKLARQLVKEVYQISSLGQMSKDFGFRDQIRRAAISVMSNIAEGFSRSSNKDFSHFLIISRGSVLEIQSLLNAALDLGYISEDDFNRLYSECDHIAALLYNFMEYLRLHPNKPIKRITNKDQGQNAQRQTPQRQTPNAQTPNA